MRFRTSSGVRQGCVLARALFCLAIDWILAHQAGITAAEHRWIDLAYAIDVLVLPNERQAASTFATFSKAAAAPFGLLLGCRKPQNLLYGL